MNKTVFFCMATLAATLFASSNNFKLTLREDSIIEGQAVKAGQYRVSFENGNAILRQGKQTIEVPAHEENVATKFQSDELSYRDNVNLIDAGFGGTNTKIVFEGPAAMHAGQ